MFSGCSSHPAGGAARPKRVESRDAYPGCTVRDRLLRRTYRKDRPQRWAWQFGRSAATTWLESGARDCCGAGEDEVDARRELSPVVVVRKLSRHRVHERKFFASRA